MSKPDLADCQWCPGQFPRDGLIAHMKLAHPQEFDRKRQAANKQHGAPVMLRDLGDLDEMEGVIEGAEKIRPKQPVTRSLSEDIDEMIRQVKEMQRLALAPSIQPAKPRIHWDFNIHLFHIEMNGGSLQVQTLAFDLSWFKSIPIVGRKIT